nr:PREDICTED: uncharacterized protein LOC109037460 [Bemisia tabaci]XP_018907685.1 PREDICTED: uncharacterized protein LOC109037460 [Bemisia tabaci]
MLKVVGASWNQIRLSWWLLAGVAVLGIITVYCGGRPSAVADRNYAATVSWTLGSGYRCDYFGQNNAPDSIKKGVARAYYQSKMAETGFAVLEIETQKEYPDFVQAYAAGYLEGSLTWQLIYWHWQNTVQKTCTDREDFCETIRTALAKNTDYIRQRATRHHKTDPFWHQIKLFYDQLDGLMYGYLAGIRRARSRNVEELDFIDFLWINIASDLRDLEKKFNSSRDFNPSKPSLALAIVKLLPDDMSKFVLGHFSAGSYSGMLRVQKKYAFGYHRTGSPESALAPGRTLLFSSYPGSLHSQDDLYLIASDKGKKLFVIGTAIQNFNTSLWDRTDLSNQIIVGPRILAANRLSVDGEMWSTMAARENSGTGNKQWLYLKPEKDKIRIWVTEMLPGISKSKEVTQILREKGFWISSNRPHFRELQSISKVAELSTDNSTKVTLDGSVPVPELSDVNPAADTLIQGQANVSDLTSLMTMLRNPDVSIVGRSDLLGVRDSALFYSLLGQLHPEEKEHLANDTLTLINSLPTNASNETSSTSNLTHVIDTSANLTLKNLEPALAANLVKSIVGYNLMNTTNDLRNLTKESHESSDTASLLKIILGPTGANSRDPIDRASNKAVIGENATKSNPESTSAGDQRRMKDESEERVILSRKDPAQNELDSEWTYEKTSNVSEVQLTIQIKGTQTIVNGSSEDVFENGNDAASPIGGNSDKNQEPKQVSNKTRDLRIEPRQQGSKILDDSSGESRDNKNEEKAQTDKPADDNAGNAHKDVAVPTIQPPKPRRPKVTDSLELSREIHEILDRAMRTNKEVSDRSRIPAENDDISARLNPEAQELLVKLVGSSEQIDSVSIEKDLRKRNIKSKPQIPEPQGSRSRDDGSDESLNNGNKSEPTISSAVRNNQSESSGMEDSDDEETMQIDSNGEDSRSDSEQTVDLSLQISGRLALMIGGGAMDDVGSNVDYNGLIDTKVVSSEFDFRVAAGPPWAPDRVVEPFSWSTSFIRNSPHIGQVDTWDYDFAPLRWAWPVNFNETSA